jgi:hypothetical protein
MFEYIRTDDGKYKCPFCDYVKEKQTTVHMHIKAKHCETCEFECEFCDYQTNIKQNLDNHLKAKHLDEIEVPIEIFECPRDNCSFACKTKGQLRSHFLLKHLAGLVNSFIKKDKHDNKLESISCIRCKESFKSKPAFTYHIVKCLPEIVKKDKINKVGLGL